MNVRLLRKIQKYITAVPARYDQNEILAKGTPGTRHGYLWDLNTKQLFPECGTIGCIAGWAVTLYRGQIKRDLDKLGYLGSAQRLLKLDDDQAIRLFSAINDRNDRNDWDTDVWPPKFVEAYNKAKTFKQRAKVASLRIDHFIKTKGAE
jgi:hypothetical protein